MLNGYPPEYAVWRVIKHELKENLYPKNGKQDDKSINAIS